MVFRLWANQDDGLLRVEADTRYSLPQERMAAMPAWVTRAHCEKCLSFVSVEEGVAVVPWPRCAAGDRIQMRNLAGSPVPFNAARGHVSILSVTNIDMGLAMCRKPPQTWTVQCR